jgi:hypothetical protein
MRQDVWVQFGHEGELHIALPAGEARWPADQGRRWLDEQFVALDCEPLRASGKVLTADKLLAVAQALGPRRLAEDEALRLDYARAALGAMARPALRVDVAAGQVDASGA